MSACSLRLVRLKEQAFANRFCWSSHPRERPGRQVDWCHGCEDQGLWLVRSHTVYNVINPLPSSLLTTSRFCPLTYVVFLSHRSKAFRPPRDVLCWLRSSPSDNEVADIARLVANSRELRNAAAHLSYERGSDLPLDNLLLTSPNLVNVFKHTKGAKETDIIVKDAIR